MGQAVLLYLHIMSSLTVVRRGRDRLLFLASHVRMVSASSYIHLDDTHPTGIKVTVLWAVSRDNFNDREGQPAYTYSIQLVDTSAIYIHIKG